MNTEFWYETLDEDARERVFAVMREIDEESEKSYAESRGFEPRPGEISVGSAAFDPFLTGWIRAEFLVALRKGRTPEEAGEHAKKAGRQAVAVHNEKSYDRNWKRWKDSGQDAIPNLICRINAAVNGQFDLQDQRGGKWESK